jgi:hypothetical protein
LFEDVTVEEPAYKEVVLLFMKKKTSQGGHGSRSSHGRPAHL